MTNKALTLTIVANMTSNYGEGLGNISSVQKVFRNGKVYATRSRESMKNAIMAQSGFYDDLQVSINGAAQKTVTKELNAANCRALEGGYMNTADVTYIRKSSFYLTDAVSCESFVNETRFHNNLFLAAKFAKDNNLNLQEKAGNCGLMPYQYEFDKSMKKYSITIDLDKVGKDENFSTESEPAEKISRVNTLLETIQFLSLVVKGNLDNSEPLFVVGGIGAAKTHYFDNVVDVQQGKLVISTDLKARLDGNNYKAALLHGHNFVNEELVEEELKPIDIATFFAELQKKITKYYEV